MLPQMNSHHYRPCVGIFNDCIFVAGNNLQFDRYELFDPRTNRWIEYHIKDPKKLRAATCYGVAL